MPLAVKLASALYALGLDPANVDFDHQPPLGMRPKNPETGETVPAPNDPRYIVPLARAAHKAKTFGNHVPLSGDVQKIKKIQRIEKDQAAFRARLLAKDAGEASPAKKGRRPWPKRAFPSRPK